MLSVLVGTGIEEKCPHDERRGGRGGWSRRRLSLGHVTGHDEVVAERSHELSGR